MAKKTKKVAKKVSKPIRKPVAKKPAPKKVQSQEIIIRVNQESSIPTTQELSEPMRDGKKLTIPKTWLNEQQLIQIVGRTPKQFIQKRKGKGGQEFDFVSGAYMEKVLNFVFAWNWDFEIMSHGQTGDHLWVMGKLTVKGTKPGETITKTQFGRAEVKYRRDSKHIPENMVDFGNDLKSAATDSLKKCASLLGIASDVYGKNDFKNETGKEPVDNTPHAQAHSNGMTYESTEEVLHECNVCGDPITAAGAAYSVKLYGKPLCKVHAAEAKPKQRK